MGGQLGDGRESPVMWPVRTFLSRSSMGSPSSDRKEPFDAEPYRELPGLAPLLPRMHLDGSCSGIEAK